MSESGEFPIQEVNVSSEDRHDEQLGSKSKFWYYDSDAKTWLFKQGRQNEDWSEKVAAVLAGHLGLPHAEVELATCDGHRGIISRSFLQKGDRLVHGNELLFELDTRYPTTSRFNTSEHTVEAVSAAFEQFHVKVWSECSDELPQSFDGQDLFLGYLLFDAWIGNSDRHHENWAVVQRGERRLLSPTYDHASSMGRNEPEARAKQRLDGRDPRVTVGIYAEKCTSALYSPSNHERPMKTMDAFLNAAGQRPDAREYWLSRLAATEEVFVRSTIQQVPTQLISDVHRRFACEVIMYNRSRLLEIQLESGND